MRRGLDNIRFFEALVAYCLQYVDQSRDAFPRGGFRHLDKESRMHGKSHRRRVKTEIENALRKIFKRHPRSFEDRSEVEYKLMQ